MTTTSHYRLTSDEFLHINSQLTNAQLRVYLHYKTLDPFGDRRVEICTKAIAEALGITQRSVQLALNKLSSMGLLVWEKAKSFVRRNVDRLGEISFASAKCRSSRRNVDRERQLELNLGEGSKSSQSSSILFNLDQLEKEENFDFENGEDSENYLEENCQISVEEAIAEIRKSIPNSESLDEDLLLSTEEQPQEAVEDNLDLEADLQLSTVANTNVITEAKPARAAVEQFVLKKLNKTFASAALRAAYFSKFDSKSWKKWETQYKASMTPQATYKPYIPEKVEVAAPDSPVVQSAFAQIKAKLGIK